MRALPAMDVLLDCGRLGEGAVRDWFDGADVSCVVARPTASELAHVSAWLRELPDNASTPNLVLVGEPDAAHRHLYDAAEVRIALGVEVLAAVPDDDRTAAVFDGRRRNDRPLKRSSLLRAASGLATALLAPREATHQPVAAIQHDRRLDMRVSETAS